MKRILFVIPSFGIGGTTVSTLNLISLLDISKYDVMVMPLLNRGVLKEQYASVPKLKPSLIIESLSVSSWRLMPNWGRKMFAMVVRFIAKNNKIKVILLKVGWRFSLNGELFDTIIACQEQKATTFVAQAPIADKVAWVRCDYTRIAERRSEDRHIYNIFRSIVCVSEGTYSSFVKLFPEYVHKTFCIENPQNTDLIKKQGEMPEKDPRLLTDRKTLVSIGRLDPVKRFTHIALIARQLKERGLQFRWYIIGDGVERNAIDKSIKDNHVEDNVMMLGAKTNPHYYIKQADLYICLSESEACPRVVNEAKILGTPTVSTDFPTIHEFIEDGKTGIISPLSEIPDAITRMFTESGLYQQIKTSISQFEFDNTELLVQIQGIL